MINYLYYWKSGVIPTHGNWQSWYVNGGYFGIGGVGAYSATIQLGDFNLLYGK